jgi:endogenous inhibitor of DNA gyrase (YacG/DUF329 family)
MWGERVMKCPTCKKSVPDPAPGDELPPCFPFCSDRCKLIDLGRWLDGKYQVPVVDREDKHGSADEDDVRGPPRRR